MNKFVNSIAALLLFLMFVLMFFSAWSDSGTMDELAHIPAGYSYITQKDYRLNPEHPPLVKDLAGISMTFANPNFPTDIKPWTEYINGQWDMGSIFLYNSRNNPETLIRLARLPMILLTLAFGLILFLWIRKHYGRKAALFTLAFYTLSPSFLAHGKYVTTDVAAALGFFIGTAGFLAYLQKPSKKTIVIAGLLLGTALLLKFSLFLLLPLFGWLILVKTLVTHESMKQKLRVFGNYIGAAVLMGIIAVVLISIVYSYHVWNYPQERQISDANFILGSFGQRWLVNTDIWLMQHTISRPFSQYLFGLLMVIQRAVGGNTTYFLGDVNSSGWFHYFPIIWFFKEPMAIHLLLLAAAGLFLKKVFSREKTWGNFVSWLQNSFISFGLASLFVLYWIATLRSNLNIGVRHILPTLPLVYLFIGVQLRNWLFSKKPTAEDNWATWLRDAYEHYISPIPKRIIVSILMAWLLFSSVATFPYFLSYYNFLGGGTFNGYKIAVDSNYDWGQDLKRLSNFVAEPPAGKEIPKIYVDYFGAGSPQYYLGAKFEPWSSAKGRPPAGSWFAISATLRQGALGNPTKGFEIKPEDSYWWLRDIEPVARAGTSIFIYKF